MYKYKAELIKVVDGDTVDLTVDLGFYIKAFIRFRLLGIDAPETRGSEKQQGLAAKEFLYEVLAHSKDGEEKQITVRSIKTGKYGRWLGVIYVNDININKLMVNQGHAVRMDY